MDGDARSDCSPFYRGCADDVDVGTLAAPFRRLSLQTRRRFLSHYRRYPRRVWVERGGARPIICRICSAAISLSCATATSCRAMASWSTGKDLCAKTGSLANKAWSQRRRAENCTRPSRLDDGELRMQLAAMGDDTVAARLAAWYARIFADAGQVRPKNLPTRPRCRRSS